MDVACQAPLSMGFSKQEYWSALPCPLLRNLPDPRIEPGSLKPFALADGFFTTSNKHVQPSLIPEHFITPERNLFLLAVIPHCQEGSWTH